mgnify:CR=1 FL=1
MKDTNETRPKLTPFKEWPDVDVLWFLVDVMLVLNVLIVSLGVPPNVVTLVAIAAITCAGTTIFCKNNVAFLTYTPAKKD